MLRTGRLLPPSWLSTLRFDAGRFPPTPAACYRAPWQLPGPDPHRLADTSLRTHTITPRASPPPPPIARALWARYAADSAGPPGGRTPRRRRGAGPWRRRAPPAAAG